MSDVTDQRLIDKLSPEAAIAYAKIPELVDTGRITEAREQWREVMAALMEAENATLRLQLEQPQVESEPTGNRESLGVMFQDKPEWFLAFLNATQQKLVQVGHILETMSSSHLRTVERLRSGNGRVSIYGGGTGISEIQAVAALSGGQLGLLHYEDPSLEVAHMFRRNMLKHNLDIPVDMSLLPLEHPDYSPPEETDFSLAMHMLYYVQGWRSTDDLQNPLRKMYNSLSDDGTGLAIVQSAQSDNYIFRNEFLPKVHGTEVAALRGEEICDALHKMNIPHRSEVVDCFTSVDHCFSDSDAFDPNSEGKKLLSFLIRSEWDQVPPDLQQQIGEHMTERTNVVDGKRAMVFRDSYIWMLGKNYQQE